MKLTKKHGIYQDVLVFNLANPSLHVMLPLPETCYAHPLVRLPHKVSFPTLHCSHSFQGLKLRFLKFLTTIFPPVVVGSLPGGRRLSPPPAPAAVREAAGPGQRGRARTGDQLRVNPGLDGCRHSSWWAGLKPVLHQTSRLQPRPGDQSGRGDPRELLSWSISVISVSDSM